MDIGSYGENLARKFLEKKGFKLIEKNFKTPRWGEIDLVMKDGDTLVFAEVRFRSRPDFGTPAQTGDVTLYFWKSGGGTNPAPVTIAKALPAGQTTTYVVSSLKEAFTGYIIAVCQFAFGHGFAFINSPSPGTGGSFAQGYTALSLPNPRLGGSAGQIAVAVEAVGQ